MKRPDFFTNAYYISQEATEVTEFSGADITVPSKVLLASKPGGPTSVWADCMSINPVGLSIRERVEIVTI